MNTIEFKEPFIWVKGNLGKITNVLFIILHKTEGNIPDCYLRDIRRSKVDGFLNKIGSLLKSGIKFFWALGRIKIIEKDKIYGDRFVWNNKFGKIWE